VEQAFRHAGIPTGIPKNVGTDADVAT